MHKSSCIVLGCVDTSSINHLPLVDTPVRAGFPSPADDYLEAKLDLTEHLVKHPSATYYIKAMGDSMVDYGIFSGDLLIVDRSLTPQVDDVVIAAIDGELTCKCLGLIQGQYYLLSGNEQYPSIALAGKELHIWGVVIHTIHSLRGRGHS
ncbi:MULTISPECIES: LexA family protein [Orbaceae]|uniref:LexA family protein n=1 Tax=Orbaceae TaxID=1240483 RepID=UPI001C64E8CC|nr:MULTISPECIES: translesion error-prone DNA polymerase V autoproteolytic subunit [Orbaceae]MCX8587164.1 translesion error-prone DNA polymerase V autoproteolytic subunit [Gilliamella sp. B3801]MCX8592082.1 translesion error-prone DNA polymerase V autoproteolytic subunit [Gilliamella sp. B3804]